MLSGSWEGWTLNSKAILERAGAPRIACNESGIQSGAELRSQSLVEVHIDVGKGMLGDTILSCLDKLGPLSFFFQIYNIDTFINNWKFLEA